MSFHKIILVSLLAILGLSLIQAKPLDPSAGSLPVAEDLNAQAAIDATTEKDKSIDGNQQNPAMNNASNEPNSKYEDDGSAPVPKSGNENAPVGKTPADSGSFTFEQSNPMNNEITPAAKPTIDKDTAGTGFVITCYSITPNIEDVESKAPPANDEKIPVILLGVQPDGTESNLHGYSNTPSLGPVPQAGNELVAPSGGPQGFQYLPNVPPSTPSGYGNEQVNLNPWNVEQNGGGQSGTNWNTRRFYPVQGPNYGPVPHVSPVPPQIGLPPNYGTRLFNDFRQNSMHPGFSVKLPAYGPFYWYPIVNEGNVVRWVLAPASYAPVLGHLPYERAISPLDATSNIDGSGFTISGTTSGFQP